MFVYNCTKSLCPSLCMCLPCSLLTCYAADKSTERQQQQLASLFGVQIKPAWLGCCILATKAQLGCSVPDLGPFTSL